MPRISLPPTPAASTEIQGKNGSPMSAMDKIFNIGSPAIAPKISDGTLASTEHPSSTMSNTFTLPPPPTRSRTIIQMKPKPQPMEGTGKTPAQRSPKRGNRKVVAESVMANSSGKKQPSSTSVAGKKIARKTAHSVIERRRRSKMNEEFATLKGMIPACTDQEMHKLAILQASIDYLRYLEKCITDLKAVNNSLSTPLIQPQAPPPPFRTIVPDDEFDDDLEEKLEDEDDEEEDDDANNHQDITMGNTTSDTTVSQSAQVARRQGSSYESPLSVTPSPRLENQSHRKTSSYASSVSTLPSPAFGPQKYNTSASQFPSSSSESISPTIMPSLEQDQEATAALLMLNQDRRHSKSGRGLSVKDLLSS